MRKGNRRQRRLTSSSFVNAALRLLVVYCDDDVGLGLPLFYQVEIYAIRLILFVALFTLLRFMLLWYLQRQSAGERERNAARALGLTPRNAQGGGTGGVELARRQPAFDTSTLSSFEAPEEEKHNPCSIWYVCMRLVAFRFVCSSQFFSSAHLQYFAAHDNSNVIILYPT